jgi:histidine kinase
MKRLVMPRHRLAWKLFASYLLIIAVGTVVLWVTSQAVAPVTFEHHLAVMERDMGRMPAVLADLFGSFMRAMNTAIAVAAAAAIAVAVAVAVFLSRRIVAPIQAMTHASQRIASGRYGERVPVTSDDELGQLASQFNRMARSLQRVEQMRRDLIADVAHELRTPLSSVAGYIEGLLDAALPPEPETFHRILREANRLQRLVTDLQELSRVEAGQVSIHPRPVGVRDLVDAAVARLRPQFDAKGITLTAELASDLPPVRADPDRIGQVLTNVLGNALQHTPRGGAAEVRAYRDRSRVAIVVRDTGAGIPAEHLPHVFDRFYRADRSRARASGGSGIGLTIARHLVEAHGGYIRADSEGQNRGSTFTFALPLAIRE